MPNLEMIELRNRLRRLEILVAIILALDAEGFVNRLVAALL